MTRGVRREAKDTWWWNENVQKTIKEKKECFKRVYFDRSVVNIEQYRIAKKIPKRAVSEARGRMFDALYHRQDTKEEEKDIYKIIKSRERKTRDLT